MTPAPDTQIQRRVNHESQVRLEPHYEFHAFRKSARGLHYPNLGLSVTASTCTQLNVHGLIFCNPRPILWSKSGVSEPIFRLGRFLTALFELSSGTRAKTGSRNEDSAREPVPPARQKIGLKCLPASLGDNVRG